MAKLILIKHSLPIIDPHAAAATWRLGAEGVERCSRLADELTPYLPAAIVSSLEPKTQATAAYLAQCWSSSYACAANLEEHHRRTAPFLGDEEFHYAMQRFFAKPSKLIFGEETADAAHARFATAIDALLIEYAAQNLMVVTHGTVLSLYLSRLIGFDPFPFWMQLGLPSFAVVEQSTQSLEAVVQDIR